jgi:eukaryotic-like serine/threonine-protein kinase
MTAVERLCPLCEKRMADEICPEDGVPTVESAIFDHKEEGVSQGTIIADRYRIERVLGKGGMGTVYLATQLSVNRPVAIKTLLKDLLSEQKHVKRFYQEARSASSLNHPNIIRIFDFGIDGATRVPFLAMEFLEGQPLSDLLEENGPVPERRAADMLAQVAKALVEAHDKDLVHRDLKPDNIFVRVLPDGEEHVKVLDFGIAKVVNSDSSTQNSLTATGMTLGTPLYMSPEQIMGEKVDFRSDLYSLGCILDDLLTGKPPFDAEERLGVLVKHMSEEPPKLPAELIDGKPPTADLVTLRTALLAKKRFDRPGTTTVVARILNALARNDQIGAASVLQDARKEALATGRIHETSSGMAAVLDAAEESGPSADEASDMLGSARTALAPTPAEMKAASVAVAVPISPLPGEALTDLDDNAVSSTSPERDTNFEEFAALVPRRSNRMVWLMAAAVLLIVGGVATALLFSGAKGQKAGDGTALAGDPQDSPAKVVQKAEPPRAAPPAAAKEAPKHAPEPASAEPKPPEPVAAAPAPEPAPEPRSVELTSTPTGAKVYLDGKQIGTTPTSIDLLPEAEPKKLRFTRAGYHEATATLAPDAETPFEVTLKRKARRRPRPAAAPVAAPTPTPAPKPPPKKKRPVVPVW